MKGVVLAGGKGSRLRPFTYSGAKQLVPIANTPVLHFPIRHLVDSGITDIAIVVGDTEAQIREAMGDGSAFGARFTYLRQPEPAGIAHAVALARPFVGDESFILYLGDNVLRGGIVAFVERFKGSTAPAAVILKAVADPRAFGVAKMYDGGLLRIIEKPHDPPSDLAVIGIYAFSPAVFTVIETQSPSPRGELEIADSINGLLDAGHEVLTAFTDEYWIDTGKMEDMLQANHVVLADMLSYAAPGSTVLDSTLEGIVHIGAGAVVERCRITGPVAIAAGASLRDCTVGPDVAIGTGSRLEQVTIRNSIVMDQSVILHSPGISDSMIGRFTRICGAPPNSRLTLGDHSCIEAVE
jgi:glucose-1-phosphate thymidylyltransferase